MIQVHGVSREEETDTIQKRSCKRCNDRLNKGCTKPIIVKGRILKTTKVKEEYNVYSGSDDKIEIEICKRKYQERGDFQF